MLLSCRVNRRIIQLGSLFQDPYYDILKDLSAENPKRFILYRFDKFQKAVEFLEYEFFRNNLRSILWDILEEF